VLTNDRLATMWDHLVLPLKMTKSPKNRRPRRPRSRSPQVNAGAQRTPNNPVQRTLTDTASTISTGVRRVFDSGAKLVRRNKSQATSDTVQQDTASMSANAPSINTPDGSNLGNNATSMTVNTPSINTPDGSNSGNNAGQGYGAMDVL